MTSEQILEAMPTQVSAQPRSTAEIWQLTGLTTAQLANLDKNGILRPSTPGRQGVSSRYYSVGHTVAAMVIADLRRRMGIDRERQLGPIARAISSHPALKESRFVDGRIRISGLDLPRWVSYDGTEVAFSKEPPQRPACLLIDLGTYISQLFWLTGVNQLRPARLRLRWMLVPNREEALPADPGVKQMRRVVEQLANDYITNQIPKEEAARLLGMTENDIREDQVEWLAAQPREDPPERESAERMEEFFAKMYRWKGSKSNESNRSLNEPTVPPKI